MNKNHPDKKALLDWKISQVGIKGERIPVTESVDIISLVKKGPYFTRVDCDSTTRLINLWPSLGAHLSSPLPPSMLRFTGIQSYSLTEQRKVETDADWMTGIELATLQLRRPLTNRLSYVCCDCHENTDLQQANEAGWCRKRDFENLQYYI